MYVVAAGSRSGIRDRRARALVVGLLACALLALAPAAADAASIIAVSPALPTDISVGDTNVPASLTITNANNGADVSSTVCEPGDLGPCTGAPGITLIPSCSALDFSQSCLPSGANPGVFSIHSASGAAGTACSTKTFGVSIVDPTFGKVRFAPSGGNVVLPNPGSSCRIDFQIDVLALPTDASGASGYQTLQSAEAAAYSNQNIGTFSRNTQAAVNITLAAPTLSDTDPDSPANDNAPRIKGSAPAQTTQVRLFTSPTCPAGSPVAQGSAATFASPGLTAPVADDTTTAFYAVAVDDLGGVSDCSTSTISYREDSTAPDAPVPNDADPDSPSNDNQPRVKGTAEAGSTVRIYANASCSGAPLATGSASSFVSPGLQVTPVPSDASTVFRAAATDAAGNLSACSSATVAYFEDSTPPATPSTTGTSPGSPANANTLRVIGAAPPGTTVKLYANPSCTGAAVDQGPAATFADPGIPTSVADNTTTTFYATTTDAAGNVSGCSSPGTAYVEDSLAPATATLTGTAPPSPANDNAPRVVGTAPAGSTVRLYTNAACTGTIAGDGSAAAFAAPGLAVTVADNTSTTFYARTVDAAGNISGCSASSVTYAEDSTAPQTTLDGGPSGASTTATPTFTFSSSDPGVTFECRIDGAPFAPCTSPFTTGPLGPGEHTFEVRARDAAGNPGASAARTFSIAGTPPPPPPPPKIAPRPQPGCVGIAGKVYVGTSKGNVRNGTNRTDIMFGLGGNDTLRGAGGLDCLYGGTGRDLLRGGSGPDRLFGGTGNDRLEGLSGNDRLSAAGGNDRVNGGTGNDSNIGGTGNDSIVDRRGRDRLSGGSGIDRIDARDITARDRRGIDRILCGPGRDIVQVDRRDSVARDCERVIRRP